MAQEAGMDLVEIQPNGDPPVCRIMDYGKFKFEPQKKAYAAKKKQKQVEIKEVKFRPVTDVGDYQIKLRKMLALPGRGRQGQGHHPLPWSRDVASGTGPEPGQEDPGRRRRERSWSSRSRAWKAARWS